MPHITDRSAPVLLLITALLTGCAATPAPHGPTMTPARMADGLMVDPRGMTLYTFDGDVVGSGKSACNGDCAKKWPPLFVAATEAGASGDFSIVKRDDGRRQWAFKGKPLYTWPDDLAPGEKYGDNYLKVWHVVRN